MAAFDVELIGVTKRFGHHAAVDDVDLEVRHGEFLSLLGPSGCGKTTTLRLIAGFERPDAGEIRIAGDDVASLPPYRRAGQHGVPVVRPLPASLGPGQRGVRAEAAGLRAAGA